MSRIDRIVVVDLHLARLRVSPEADRELEWVFNAAESAMGTSSNFRALLFGWGEDWDDRTAEDRAEASHAHRAIRRWLAAMPDSDVGVLRAAYEGRNWPHSVRERLGRLTGVAVRLACAPETWPTERKEQEVMEMIRARELEAAIDVGHGKAALLRLGAAAQGRFSRATRAYADVRGVRPCCVPEAP
jgi:hypothetical protein